MQGHNQPHKQPTNYMQQQEQQTTGIQKTTIRFYLIRGGKGDIIFAKIKNTYVAQNAGGHLLALLVP